jgi:tight adherence protein B
VNRVLTARGWGDPIQRRIEDAGWRMRTSEFVVLQLTAVLACAVLMWFVPVPGLLKLAAVIAVALGPLVFLDRKAAKRRRRFEDQIPDVLTLMANSLRAGQGFEQALQVVANEGPDPSAHEFRRLLAQQRLGVSPEETLRTLADRMQSEAFGWVVMVTAIQREVGGNLAEVYTNIAETLRERAKLRREVDTLTAEGKLSAGILILLPIVVGALIYLLNRAYFMLLLTTRGGQVMICGTLTLMVVGIVWMRRIIHFEI